MWRFLLAGLLLVPPKKKFICETVPRRLAFVRHGLLGPRGVGRTVDTRGPHQGGLDADFCDELWGHAVTNWKDADLQKELAKVQSCGWLAYFEVSATALDIPRELLLAIASRETGMANVPGDFHDGQFHGFGIMQVDRGTDAEFCCSWHPDDVKGSIQRGAEILAEKRAFLVTKRIATTKNIAAAYNAGQGRIWAYVQQKKNPDLATTGGNYGADVLARSLVFAQLLVPPVTK